LSLKRFIIIHGQSDVINGCDALRSSSCNVVKKDLEEKEVSSGFMFTGCVTAYVAHEDVSCWGSCSLWGKQR